MSENSDSAPDKQADAGEPPLRRSRGRWAPGHSGNPSGKSKGCRSHLNRELDKILQSNGPDILERILKGARSGDTACMKLVLERLVPPRKSRMVQLDNFPRVETIEDADQAQTRILEAVTKAEIDLEEAQGLSELVAEKRRLLEARDLVARVRALEAKAGATGPLLDQAALPQPFRQLPSLFDVEDGDEP